VIVYQATLYLATHQGMEYRNPGIRDRPIHLPAIEAQGAGRIGAT
jgi:hypothetical protein